MSTKEIALETIQELPENASWEQVEERISFMAAVEEGRKQVVKGEGVAHHEVKALLKGWLTK